MMAALAACGDGNTVRTPFGRCERVSAGGKHGDFNVRCPVTDELVALSKQRPNVKFLSDMGDRGAAVGTPTILVNVQHDELGPGKTCYHILAIGMDVAKLPKKGFYAILFCPEN